MLREHRTCHHESHPMLECQYCGEVVCKSCYTKLHGANCALKLMDKILRNEPIGFIMDNNEKVDIYPVTQDGYLVRTFRTRKLKSGEIKRYGPFWERHRWDKTTKKASFVKYIGKIFHEY